MTKQNYRAKRLFQSYIGTSCFTLLYNYHTLGIKQAKSNEPIIHKFSTISINEEEIRLREIDEIIQYEDVFDDVVREAEYNIHTLCEIATKSYTLWDLLEDIIKHAIDNKTYTIGHLIIEYLDNQNDLDNEQINNLSLLAKGDKEVFEGIIGYS